MESSRGALRLQHYWMGLFSSADSSKVGRRCQFLLRRVGSSAAPLTGREAPSLATSSDPSAASTG